MCIETIWHGYCIYINATFKTEEIMQYQVQDVNGKWHNVSPIQAAAYKCQGVPIRVIKDGK